MLTSKGEDVAVLLSLETFEDMQAAAGDSELQQAIDAAERGIEDGHWVEHSEVEAKLKRWAAGGS